MAKLVLGKGLKALIPDHAMEIKPERKETIAGNTENKSFQFRNTRTGEVGTIGNIPISKITPNPFQPRLDFDRTALDELKQSIKEKGIIQPITVRLKLDGDGYELISGERRLRAATEAGFAEVPAYVIEVKTDREMIELALIENIQREKLNPIEVAQGYQRLADECNLTQEEIAQKVSKDRTSVTNSIRLLKLPSEIQQSLRTNSLSMGHARALLAVEDTAVQMEVWRQIIEEGLSVRKVESLVTKMSQSSKKKKAKSATTDQPKTLDILQVESTLREKLATKIKINHTKTGSGEIVIQYYSVDDLERLIDTIGNSHS
jgi:ParB family chromosome partitioning protein